MERYCSAVPGEGEGGANCLFLQMNVLRDLLSQTESDLNVFQKTLLRYYLFEGLRYIWLDRKGAFCRVRYRNRKPRNA